jgi:hypothetical protein
MADDQQQQNDDQQQQQQQNDDQQQDDRDDRRQDDDQQQGDDERAIDEIRKDPAGAFRRMLGLQSEAGDYRRRLRDVERERDELKRAGLDDQERAVAEAEARGRQAAEEAYGRRTLEAEIRAAAAGKLQDPADAIRYLDVAALLELDDERERERELGKAIDKLVDDKPYLAGTNGDGPTPTRGVPRSSQGARSRAGGGTSADQDGNAWMRKAAGRSRR